jgi:hypothetical protein
MKKILKNSWLLVLVLIFLDPSASSAQGKLELTPFAGYQFGGKLRMYQGDLKFKDNMNYGLVLDYEIATDSKLEFLWAQMNTTAEFRPYYGWEEYRGSFDLDINYFQIGGVREINNGQVRPFGAFTLGATYFHPKDNIVSDSWQFSMTLGGGAKIWLSDRVGIRLQGRLLMPMYFTGVGIYAGIGTGGASGGLGVGAGATVLQGDLSAGLMIAIGE